MDQVNPASAIILEVLEDGGILRARFDPSVSTTVADIALLKQALQRDGYDSFHLDELSVEQFLLRCASSTDTVEMEIGERRSASYALEVADDLMSAWLTLTAAEGGNPIGVEVHDALRDQGITCGILHKELNDALARGWCDRLLVAAGERPRLGTPACFDVLFGENNQSRPIIDEKAKIRYQDLSHLLLVHANDPLMRRHPPVQGKNGTNIKGQVVFPEPLPELTFGLDLQGAIADPADPNLLVAAHAGQPVQVADGVIVNPVINVKNVDLTTGNIVFEGTVHVEGDIKTDMTVKVTGDVIVNGMVESADVIAGGNVAVKGGIIGRAEKTAGTQKLASRAARIQCSGSAQALFMENTHVEAGNAILIAQNARHCELIARNEIIVGGSGPRNGQIIGGRIQASLLVQADIVGTSVATKTRIQVGLDPYLEEQIFKLQNLIQRKVAELDQVLKLIVFFERNPHKNVDGIADKVEAKRVQQLSEIDQLTAEADSLEAQMELVAKACIKISTTIYDGAELQIGKQTWKVREDTGGGTYKLVDGNIVLV